MFIGFTFDDYEASGGFNDAIKDREDNVIEFKDVESCVASAMEHNDHCDNLDVYSRNDFKLVAAFSGVHSWDAKNNHSFKYVKEE